MLRHYIRAEKVLEIMTVTPVLLIILDGFGYRETAELLDLPIGTVSSRLVRGRKALLAMVKEEYRGDR